jgi:MYXO-CTERM domain-containing protein
MEVLEAPGSTFLKRQSGVAGEPALCGTAGGDGHHGAFMASLMALMFWGLHRRRPGPASPLVSGAGGLPGIVILGVLLAMTAVQEIEKGEIDDARKY